MASPSILRTSQCLSCAKRVTTGLESAFQLSNRQQIRGLKKDAGTATTKVVLLQDITRYGAKGSIIKVPTGTMRNLWFPKRMAAYLTKEKSEELGIKKDAELDRDSTFPSRKQRKLAKKEQAEGVEEQAEQQLKTGETKVAKELKDSLATVEEASPLEAMPLSPEESTSILEKVLPPNLEFFRTPVAAIQVEERISPSIPRGSTVSAAARAGKEAKTPTSTNIIGSVSTNDIATNLKAILAEDKQAAKILLASEDISFVKSTGEKDRVNHLGKFEFQIKLKGATMSVRRTIQVQAQG